MRGYVAECIIEICLGGDEAIDVQVRGSLFSNAIKKTCSLSIHGDMHGCICVEVYHYVHSQLYMCLCYSMSLRWHILQHRVPHSWTKKTSNQSPARPHHTAQTSTGATTKNTPSVTYSIAGIAVTTPYLIGSSDDPLPYSMPQLCCFTLLLLLGPIPGALVLQENIGELGDKAR